MVNQDEGQKSSLVGAKALDPDTCDANSDYEEEGQNYFDDCQEHKLNDQLRWHLYVCTRDTSRITRFWDDDKHETQITLKLASKCLRLKGSHPLPKRMFFTHCVNGP